MNSKIQYVEEQRIGPHELCADVGHKTSSIDHGCVQLCCSMCSEDVAFYLGCYYVHLGNHFESETEES